MLKVAIIGFGGIARLHQYAYRYHAYAGMPIKLVAACDVDPEIFRKNITINLDIPDDLPAPPPIAEYTDWRQMLDTEHPDLIDICLPTRFHEDVAVEALKRGCAVLCEKPMAIDYAACRRMLEAATPGKLMIAHSVRFYPQYEYLYEAVRSGRYGKVLRARFDRVTPLPQWGNHNWRNQDPRIGSCLTELNIHDIDVMQHLFGHPQSVSCRLESRATVYDRSLAQFSYDGFDVEIFSEWQDDSGHFCMSYRVDFEQGTLTFDGTDVFFVAADGERQPVTLPGHDGVVGEIGYFADLLLTGKPNTLNPPEQSAYTMFMLEKCFESHDCGESVAL